MPEMMQPVSEAEPQNVSGLRELQVQARTNTGFMRDLREDIDRLDRQQQSLINEGRVEETMPLQSSKESLEKKLQKRRIRANALRRRKLEIQEVERKAQEDREREERIASRNPGRQGDLESRKKNAIEILDSIAQDSESLLRSARNNQDHDLARRLMGVHRGAEAALEALKRTPSVVDLKND